ncbi:Hsp70 family protein [Cyanobium sp. ATX 6A2]|uniref:Hsp70 family protein n=1 Tax=Cyanobium sp. ATX 6A2 TaxID=2823700 RepID=UPI0020CD13C0|nr:Hsp70 family protein [Cyanobium sp. ATX 6A2]MCP9888323.1 Hsp70 family protein [Cyanobium sp. ATX 6A2]
MQGTVAIDLGSTTTVVAHQPPGGAAELLALPPYSLAAPVVVPSLLWLSHAGQARPLIGRQVLEAGLAHHDDPRLQRDFKRRIAATPVSAGAGSVSAERAGSLLLQHLWQALPPGLEPRRLVLTAPIEAYRGYRQWLLEACRNLEVQDLALVDEPTAAAIGAGLPAGSTVLVVDLGGGTIDLSLVQLDGGEGRAAPIAQLLRFAGRNLNDSCQQLRCARVIGKAGVALGGRDIDRWIADLLCPDQAISGSLLDASERLKCQLSEQSEALVLWSPPLAQPRELRLGQAGLEALLRERGLIEHLDALLAEVLAAGRRAGLALERVTAVLPVGGTSQLPAIRDWIRQRCADVPILNQRPVEAVALGALALTPGVQVKDVLSRGVSLRCWEQRSGRHHWHPLFMAGQSWPTDQPLDLVLACSRDGQQELELVLGEPLDEQRREVVFEAGLPVLRSRGAGAAGVQPWDQRPTALPLSPAGERGQDRLRLRFRIDADGQLLVDTTDLLSGEQRGPVRLGVVR